MDDLFDEIVALAERRALLRAEIAGIDARLEELRPKFGGRATQVGEAEPSAPSRRSRRALAAPAGRKRKASPISKKSKTSAPSGWRRGELTNKVLDLMRETGETYSAKELAEALKIEQTQARNTLVFQEKRGTVVKVAPGRYHAKV